MTPTTPRAAALQTIRCAIYTRKSTDEGLDQEFNSLAAQREAAQAYIASQHAASKQGTRSARLIAVFGRENPGERARAVPKEVTNGTVQGVSICDTSCPDVLRRSCMER